MASTKHWVPKVNRHCRVFLTKSVTNALGQTQANYTKRRSATVTAIAADSAPQLKQKRSGQTHGNSTNGVVRQIDSTVPVGGDAAGETRLPGAASRTGKYISQ